MDEEPNFPIIPYRAAACGDSGWWVMPYSRMVWVYRAAMRNRWNWPI